MERDTIGRPMEIMLVEDSLAAARLTMGALKNSGFQHRLTWLRDGREAMDFLHQTGRYVRAPQPDLVLLDLLLPEVDGWQILREIRSTPRFEGLAVVIMTSATESRDAVIPAELRVDGYLQKPINVDEFLQLLRTLKDLWAADMILPEDDRAGHESDAAEPDAAGAE
ncbi:MAG: response regulator [Planctomyces sp.]|nr:response regulator [Planctomyces sp.]